ncbi:MAG: hypothetical protein L3K08_01900 [Thermoplasmata archaeon]|nr:hypothetical protein [Thermoplasmata archaeon]
MESETSPGPTPAAPRGVRCDLCGASLADEGELRVHLEGHAERRAEGLPAIPEGPLHRCPFCTSGFDTPEELKAHLAAGHGK